MTGFGLSLRNRTFNRGMDHDFVEQIIISLVDYIVYFVHLATLFNELKTSKNR